MEDFKFKVGDKIRLSNWSKESYVTINYIGNKLVFVTSKKETESVEGIRYLKEDWELYKEPKQKIKLQKFYYSVKDIWFESYAASKIDVRFRNVLTEEEFLEKFEINK